MATSTKPAGKTAAASSATIQQPQVTAHLVKMGKTKQKHLKKLKNGHGKLASEIEQIVAQKMATLPPPPEGKTYQPVVVAYHEVLSKKEKKKRKKKARKKARKKSMYGLNFGWPSK